MMYQQMNYNQLYQNNNIPKNKQPSKEKQLKELNNNLKDTFKNFKQELNDIKFDDLHKIYLEKLRLVNPELKLDYIKAILNYCEFSEKDFKTITNESNQLWKKLKEKKSKNKSNIPKDKIPTKLEKIKTNKVDLVEDIDNTRNIESNFDADNDFM